MNGYRIVAMLALVLALLMVAALPLLAEEPPPIDDDDVTAFRWQAMAQFYADQGMLNEDAAVDAYWEATAARWAAMGEVYEARAEPLWGEADYAEAAECQKIRWLAMADYYAKHDMLTRTVADS